MQLREFSFTPAQIKPGELLKAIETVVAPEVVNHAIQQTRSQEQRNRILPTHLVIALMIAMSLWSTDSIVDVLKNLVSGLSTRWKRKRMRDGKLRANPQSAKHEEESVAR